jgi:hypothetical protein
MWRYWRLIDPRKAIVATGIWMAGLAFMIHLVVSAATGTSGSTPSRCLPRQLLQHRRSKLRRIRRLSPGLNSGIWSADLIRGR